MEVGKEWWEEGQLLIVSTVKLKLKRSAVVWKNELNQYMLKWKTLRHQVKNTRGILVCILLFHLCKRCWYVRRMENCFSLYFPYYLNSSL